MPVDGDLRDIREIDNRSNLSPADKRSSGTWEKLKMQMQRQPIVRWIWNHNLHLFVQPRGATSSGIIRVHLITEFYVRALKTKE